MTKPVRAALYARVSTTGHGQDVGLQLDELRQVAAQRGWDAAAYVDEGVSGSKDRRPALDRLMADARAGRLDVIAVWRFDRFARDTRHLLTAMEEVRGLGVSFVSLHPGIIPGTRFGSEMPAFVQKVAPWIAKILRLASSPAEAAARFVAVGTGEVEAGGFYYEGELREAPKQAQDPEFAASLRGALEGLRAPGGN